LCSIEVVVDAGVVEAVGFFHLPEVVEFLLHAVRDVLL
jgi:hypothetical protein